VKKSVAKLVLLTSLVLSAFSIAGAIATGGKDGGNPFPPGGNPLPPATSSAR